MRPETVAAALFVLFTTAAWPLTLAAQGLSGPWGDTYSSGPESPKPAAPSPPAFDPYATGVTGNRPITGRAGLEPIEREDLAPVLSPDGSGLPQDIWGTMSVAEIEQQLASIPMPLRSPTLFALFAKLLTADSPPPAGARSAATFAALRAEVLERAGLIDDAQRIVSTARAEATDPPSAVIASRLALVTGDQQTGCRHAREIFASVTRLPPRLKGEAVLISAICAAASGNLAAAGLHLALARESGAEVSAGLEAIDLFAAGGKARASGAGPVSPLDWRALEIAGAADAGAVLPRATPSLHVLLARAPSVPANVRVLAAEAAAAANALSTDDLASFYRSVPETVATAPANANPAADPATSLRRAALFQAAEAERSPVRKARLIRSFLDEARNSGSYWQALAITAGAAATLKRAPEVGWFAETGIETALAAGDYPAARAWADFAATLDGPTGTQGAGHGHWKALADLADPTPGTDRARNLGEIERLASHGRMDPTFLHRLATALDALDIQVPIPLWDIASRTPQPDGGHLPETGVLSDLAAASKKKELARTVLLTLRTLGPAGAEGAHIIALGDAIRALRRAGLEADAHRLALEALFATWPHAVTN